MTCVMMIYNLTHAAKIGRAARPLEPYDKANPTRAFVARRGEVRAGRGGGIIGIEGRKGETMGTTQRKWDLFRCILRARKHEFERKKNKVKIV